MNKKIILSSFASLFFLSQVANAEYKVGNAGVITGNIAANSHYFSKGLEQNRDKPTASLTGEFASSTDIQVILGAGIFYARPDKPVTSGAGYDYELDYNIGLRKTIDKLTLDAGYVYFAFPGADAVHNLDSGSYYAKAAFQATKDTKLSFSYEADDTKGAKSTSGKVAKYYYELGLSHNLGPVTANLAYGDFDDIVTHYRVGIAKEFKGLNFTVDYINNDKTPANVVDKHDNEFVVVGVSKSF
jgi:uncharacterized protein (TIGR02001 family)